MIDDLMSALYRQNAEVEHEAERVVITYNENNFEEKLSKAKELRQNGTNVALEAE